MPDQNPAKAAAEAAFPDAETPTTMTDGGAYVTDEEKDAFNQVADGHGQRAAIEGVAYGRRARGEKVRQPRRSQG